MPRPTLHALIFLAGLAAPCLAAQLPDQQSQTRALERYRAGQELLRTDAFAGAADEFRAAIDIDPTFALAHYGLGQAHMGLKSYTQAVQAFTRCRQVYEEAAATDLDRGERVNRWVQDEIRALQDQQRQVESRLRLAGSTNATLQRALAQINQRIAQLEQLRHRQDRPTSAPPGVALALGSAYLRAGQMDAAEREYLAALDGNPKMGEAHNNLAYLYMVTGRLPDAERELKLAEKHGYRVNPAFKAELERKRN
jgi:tetratricopeptide (TPR) repeat protein